MGTYRRRRAACPKGPAYCTYWVHVPATGLGTYRVYRGTRRWEPTNRYPQRWKKSVAQNPPKVCVQLPMFNETFVARRVIDYTCRMDYPRHAFEVPALP